jgi:glycolate oxidase
MLEPSARRELVLLLGGDPLFDDPSHRRVYDADAYAFAGIQPDAIVLPSTARCVEQIVGWCHRQGIPYVARGAGTGLSGGCLTAEGGILIGTARLNRILEIDPFERVARVEPGVVNTQLNRRAARHGLSFAPDPSSQNACTVGGNFAENSGGPHTLKNGVTLPHVLGVSLVGERGRRIELGGRHLPGSGADLLALSVGSEGCAGIAVELLLRLIPLPTAVETFLIVYDELADAARSVSAMVAAGILPAAMELIDQVMLRAVEKAFSFGFPLDAGGVLIVEVDGEAESVAEDSRQLRAVCESFGAREIRQAATEAERAHLWKARKHSFGAIGRVSPNYATQDGVVPRASVPEIVRCIRETSARHDIGIGTVIHAGDGNIHPCVLFDNRKPEQVKAALAASAEILERCIELEGSPSGEHGIGLEKRGFMGRLFGFDDLAAMEEIRASFDPSGLCNPGKVLPGPGGCGELRALGRQVPQ